MNSSVSLCMIVRNEEKNLPKCLEGLQGMVGEIIVLDTGSTDRTKTVAAELGAKVYDFPWDDDFSAARNESRRRAAGDWVLWLDADDRLDASNRAKLGELLAQLPSYDAREPYVFLLSVLLREPTMASNAPMGQARLFSRKAGISWRGFVHEHLVGPDGDDRCFKLVRTDVTIEHHGYEVPEQYQRKLQRNLRLLQRAYLLNPCDGLTAYYLGKTSLGLGDSRAAIHFLRASIRLDPMGKLLSTRLAYAAAVECLRQGGRAEEAAALCREGLAAFPTFEELLHAYACLMVDAGQWGEAERSLKVLLAQVEDPLSLTGSPMGPLRLKAQLLLAEVLRQQGRWAESEGIYLTLAAAAPDCPEPWFGLSQLAVATGRRDLLARATERLSAFPQAAGQAALLRAQGCIMDRQWDQARAWIRKVLQLSPDMPDAYLLLSDVHFQSGSDLAESIRVHRQALARIPGHAEVRRRLAILEERARQAGLAVPRPTGINVTVADAGVTEGPAVFAA